MEWIIEKKLTFTTLTVQIILLGNDYTIVLQGGELPHIGCTVLAIPRPSLTGDGSVSSTASVLNITGHKDEFICRRLAERIAVKKQAVTVCTGGFHMDDISAEQIKEVMEVVDRIGDEI